MKKNIKKIYSIQTHSNNLELVEIETIILRGLYRFSILGINQKNSSDIKDRVYSALRSQKLTNLKSENKKITVNLLPNNIEKKGNTYDLPIALSCLFCTEETDFNQNILAIGELSILGNIIPSKKILKCLYVAIKKDIKVIICSTSDLKIIDNTKYNFYEIINKNNIKFIVGDNLNEIIYNIKNLKYYNFVHKCNKNINDYFLTKKLNKINIEDNNIIKIILGICCRRNIFIENIHNSYIKNFIKNLIYYSDSIYNNEILKISNNLNEVDEDIINNYTKPYVYIVDNQANENIILLGLNRSLFGINIIEDIIKIAEDKFYFIKNNFKSTILCFYNTCLCGNNNTFFNKSIDNRCLCLQRNIVRYRQKIKRIENNFFDFYINDLINKELTYTFDDYININNFINFFRNTELNIKIDNKLKKEIDLIMQKNLVNNMDHKDNIIKLAKDIKKYEILNNKKLNNMSNMEEYLLNEHDINIAINMLKKDF